MVAKRNDSYLQTLAAQIAKLTQTELSEVFRIAGTCKEEAHELRKIIIKCARETLPASPPGRKKKIKLDQLPELLARSEELQPALAALLGVCKISPGRPLPSVIAFIEPDYPRECAYLRKYLRRLESLRRDRRLLQQVATLETGVRLLADAMAGADFDLSARYSIQRAQTARRGVAKTESTDSKQKI